MDKKDLKLLPPDLYSRNTIIAKIAEILFKDAANADGKTLRILDVGGYGAELHRFFPDSTDFTLLDLKEPPAHLRYEGEDEAETGAIDPEEIPEDQLSFTEGGGVNSTDPVEETAEEPVIHPAQKSFLNDGEAPQPQRIQQKMNYKYRQANAQRIPYSDRNFDLVVCTDMLEHVDKPYRAPVIRELLRVSKNHVLIGLPVDNNAGLTVQAEAFIRQQHVRNTGSDHPFLIEHAVNGLPQEEKIDQVLVKEGVKFVKVKEGNLMNWFIQQLHTGTTNGIELEDLNLSFNRFFNEHLEELGNLRTPAYRTFYCISKEGELSEQAVYEELLTIHKWKPEVFMELLDKAFQDMRNIMNGYAKKIAVFKTNEVVAEESLRQKEQSYYALLDKYDAVKKKFEEDEAYREHLKKELQDYIRQIAELEEKIHKARISLQKHREIILELRNFLSEKEQAINLTREMLKTKEAEITELAKRNREVENKLDTQGKFMRLLASETQKKTLEIDHLKDYIKHTESIMVQKREEIKDLNAKFIGVSKDLENHQNELRSVITSRAWKSVMAYSWLKTNLFIRPWKLARKGIAILINLGPRVFAQRFMRKIRKTMPNRAPLNEYEKFIAENNPTTQKKKSAQKAIENFGYKPVVSIIMPVYNIDEEWLRKAIKSVMGQWYVKWELCICDDASTKESVKKVLESYSLMDERIKVVYRQKNGGIVKATNDALKLATGAYVGFLDNDDELTEDALYETVKALQSQKYDLLYSDEDKIDMTGKRCDPFFKPDWSPDLLLSINYICHFAVYRRKILSEIGGLREGFDGSQDYDLLLRYTEKTGNIKHIPKILYHWRKIPGSTAAEFDAKPYAFDAAKKALEQAMKRRGITASIEDGLWKGSYRVKRISVSRQNASHALHGLQSPHVPHAAHVPHAPAQDENRPHVSIIIPFKDHVDVLRPCLDSILNKTTYEKYEIILVNNQSELFETAEFIRELENSEYRSRIKIYNYNHPFNFSAINNYAAEKASGEILLLLNNDTEVINNDWIEAMLEHATRPEVGAVGAKLLYKNDLVQHAGVLVGVGGIANHAFLKQWKDDNGYFGLANVVRNYSAVTGACMMVRKDLYKKMGGLNEKELAVTFNDVDFCLRLREAGYLIVYTPYSQLYHYESLSRGYDVNLTEVAYMQRNHAGLLREGDPYYNPNLTREKFDFSLP